MVKVEIGGQPVTEEQLGDFLKALQGEAIQENSEHEPEHTEVLPDKESGENVNKLSEVLAAPVSLPPKVGDGPLKVKKSEISTFNARSFKQALAILKMALWLVSIVLIFNFYSGVKQFQTDRPKTYLRFEFWCHIEMMCFTMNIVAFMIHGLLRFLEGGSFINAKGQQYEDYLKSALESGYASWFAVEMSVTASLALTYWIDAKENENSQVQDILKWWLPVMGASMLLLPVTHLLMERATYMFSHKD